MNRRNFIKGFLATVAVATLAPLASVVELSTEKATFESITALTLQKYRYILAENILSKPVFRWELMYGQHRVNPKSRTIAEPIIYS